MATNYLPGDYTIPAAVKGDTFAGIPELSVTVNDAPPANSLASVRMHFRPLPASTYLALELASVDGDITINDAATWNITVEPFVITINAGTYYYDIEFTDSAGNVVTYVSGTWKIAQDVTR